MVLIDLLTQIANSIRNKDGTTEPIVATDFPQRILNIPSGSSNIVLSHGTFTPAENTNTVTVEHGLSTAPNFGIVFIIDNVSSVSNSGFSLIAVDIPLSGMYKHYEVKKEWGNIKAVTSGLSSEQQFVYDDNKITFNTLDASLLPSKNYMWICGKVKVNE